MSNKTLITTWSSGNVILIKSRRALRKAGWWRSKRTDERKVSNLLASDHLPKPAPSSAILSFLAFDQGTFAFRQGAKCLVTTDRLEDFDQVPGTRRFCRGLDLGEVHVMHHPAVLTKVAAGRKHVVDRRRAHLGDDRQRLISAGILDRLQIMTHRRIGARLNRGRHRAYTV